MDSRKPGLDIIGQWENKNQPRANMAKNPSYDKNSPVDGSRRPLSDLEGPNLPNSGTGPQSELQAKTRHSHLCTTTNVPVRHADGSRTKIYHTSDDSEPGVAFGAIEIDKKAQIKVTSTMRRRPRRSSPELVTEPLFPPDPPTIACSAHRRARLSLSV